MKRVKVTVVDTNDTAYTTYINVPKTVDEDNMVQYIDNRLRAKVPKWHSTHR